MPPFYKYVCRLQPFSGLPKDQYENTWYTDNLGGAVVPTALTAFYNSLSTWLSTEISSGSGNLKIDVYSKTLGTEPTWGPPDTTYSEYVTGITGSSNLPGEVACCLSFHADLTGIPEYGPPVTGGEHGKSRLRARRRGRVYIGPLSASVMTLESSTQTPRLAAGFLTALTGAATTLKSALTGEWCVYSKVDNAMHPVVGGWADNEFDTVRRRGRTSSSKTLF